MKKWKEREETEQSGASKEKSKDKPSKTKNNKILIKLKRHLIIAKRIFFILNYFLWTGFNV